MSLDELFCCNLQLKQWIVNELNNPGPWQLKAGFKQKINCLLNFKLSGISEDAMEIRGYLNDNDPDVIWIESMQSNVIPFILAHRTEVCYG